MREWVTAVAVAGFTIATAVAQTAQAAFEVVSVKINRSGEIPMRITAPPGRFEATNVTARLLILNSYGLPDFRLANLPAWAGDERFDVAGRAAEPASRDEISAMVRAMLEDRFQLRAHRETRELPTCALVPASADRRPGLALRTSSIDCSAPEDRSKCNTRITPRSLTATGMTMTRLAATLTGIVGRVITDETGLPGAYTWSSRLRRRGLCLRGRHQPRPTATRRRSSPPCASSSGSDSTGGAGRWRCSSSTASSGRPPTDLRHCDIVGP